MSERYPTDKELAVSIVNTYIASRSSQYEHQMTAKDITDLIETVNKTLVLLPRSADDFNKQI